MASRPHLRDHVSVSVSGKRCLTPLWKDGLWDFPLVDHSAAAGSSYCFRVLKSDGTVVDTYSVIPEITTSASSRRRGASGSHPRIY